VGNKTGPGVGNKVEPRQQSTNILNLILIAFSVLIIFSFGCTKKQEKEIKIGIVLPLTGDGAVYGIKEKEGIELAIHEKNSSGGIRGKQIQAVFEDSKGEPSFAVSSLQKLINQDKVRIVIGDAFSSPTLAMIPVIDKNKIILMSPSASSPKLSNSSEYFFRVWPSDTAEGKVAAEAAIQRLKLGNIAILYGNNEYGLGLKTVFASTINNLGGKILITETYNEGDTDFRTQLSKIKEMMPDGIYLAGYAKEFSKILIQARELNIKSQFISCGTFHEPEILRIAGKAAEGVVFIQPFFDRNSADPNVQQFVRNYESKFGTEAGVYAAHSYDAAKVLIMAIDSGGVTPDKIKTVLMEIKDFQGVTGKITFSKGGDVVKPSRVMAVKNNRFVDF